MRPVSSRAIYRIALLVPAVLVLVSTAALRAQSAPPVPPVPPLPPLSSSGGREMNITIMRHGPEGGTTELLLPGDDPFDFASLPLAMGGEPVVGAPYSAEAVTDVVQVLADGNRITRQTKTSLYRDGKGRTRREPGLSVLGGLVGRAGPGNASRDGNGDTRVQIHDPEAGAMYLLDTGKKEAHRLPAPRVRIALRHDGNAVFGDPAAAASAARPGRHDEVTTIIRHRREVRDAQVEALGTRTIEGVPAEGTRTTMTIPAGQIGNEQPIVIVSERWYSPDLQALVMSRQSDPRYGETTYRLTGIVRAEPAPELFQVPADYRVIDTLKDLDGLGDRLRKEVDETLQKEFRRLPPRERP